MLELMLCSLLTVVPDFLYRRFAQGKRIGKQITIYSVWYELRYGITACLMLTITLITIIFYNHPATSNVTSFFRTIPVLPETSGRVAEVFVNVRDEVHRGAPILRLDNSAQQAALETARKRVAQIDASMVTARSEIAAAEGQVQEARSSYQQALDELETKQELRRRNADIVAAREIEKLQNLADARKGGVAAAEAALQASQAKLAIQLPADKASAEAALAQAQVDLDKTIVRAGVDGKIEQFTLRVGDIVNPFMRPGGILIPTGSGRGKLQAGFGQIEAQVMKPGMAAEVVCISKPFAVVPMVVTDVQDFIAAGQVRAGEQLVDAQQVQRPGTILVFMEPMYEGSLDDLPPGSSCIANAYSSNHELLASGKVGGARWLYLHVVDTVALVHAMILRIQALLMPVQTLVFSKH